MHQAAFEQYWAAVLFVLMWKTCVNITDMEKSMWAAVLRQYRLFFDGLKDSQDIWPPPIQSVLDHFGIKIASFKDLYAAQLAITHQNMILIMSRLDEGINLSRPELDMLATIADFTRFYPNADEIDKFWFCVWKHIHLVHGGDIIMTATLRPLQDANTWYNPFQLVHEMPDHLIEVRRKHTAPPHIPKLRFMGF